ncbi:hypothetical protein [Rheinheimera tangshanensis]|jgi:hypothetical protein|uniref:Uncharacterized protein n=1 Tax=Rheinheimera tangshanensis TaxID=400153 RepID=A0A5C8LY98_9GAMM|nr:hypothetical protein [Rheinheimera tangshanensis]TXK81314.1 hypothetical protein FU839_09400 [Rheinheimera tangshanensis]GGM59847.1 hypothetical protein GCM10010920_20600 [Rheinheimera tangshanensis]
MQKKIVLDIRKLLVEHKSNLLTQFDELVSEGNAKKIFLLLDEQITTGQLRQSIREHMTELYFLIR